MNYSEPSVLHPKTTLLPPRQIYQRKHLFNKCESLLYVLFPCHCILVSILLASNTHKAENLLQLVKQNRTKIQWIFTGETNMNVLLKVLTYWKDAKFSNIGGLSISRCMWGKNILVSFQCRDERNLTYCDAPRLPFIYTSLYRSRVHSRRWWQITFIDCQCVKHVSSALHKGNYCCADEYIVLFSSKSQILLCQPVMFKAFQ